MFDAILGWFGVSDWGYFRPGLSAEPDIPQSGSRWISICAWKWSTNVSWRNSSTARAQARAITPPTQGFDSVG